MGIPVLILGASGTGKTYALKTLKLEEYGLISVEKTTLPFLSKKKFAHKKDFDGIRAAIEAYAEAYHCVVVDDLGYAVVDLFMQHIYDRDQYTIYKSIAEELYKTIEFVNDLDDDAVVYITFHIDVDAAGSIVPKILGKMVNEKIELQGMCNFVFLAEIVDGEHVFIVDGKPPAKSIEGVFNEPTQPNDLQAIDSAIRDAMGLKPRGASTQANKTTKKGTDNA